MALNDVVSRHDSRTSPALQPGVINRLNALLRRNSDAEERQEAVLRRAQGQDMPPSAGQAGGGPAPAYSLNELLDHFEKQIIERESQNQRFDEYL
jgi:hypothetical protein